ncbi:uncharacterized protein LOC135394177 isoform X2 [Ornithodoros turicata]|uniref:uncharacterized protein LOC135394177 isoform X2 n=1 Tax=Ornithodoros turicata TaxID=34597 RepID=UPI003139CC85
MCDKALEQAAKESACEGERKQDTSVTSAFPDALDTPPGSNESGENSGGGKPQFYIEVDASAMANLKAGTQYTLVPVDAEQRAAAAAANDHTQQQQLAWCQPMDGRLPEDDVNGSAVEGVTKEELSADTFSLDQSIMNGFGTSKAESQDSPPVLDADFEGGAGDGPEKMTYAPLISVAQQQHQHHQQDATASAVASHMVPLQKRIVQAISCCYNQDGMHLYAAFSIPPVHQPLRQHKISCENKTKHAAGYEALRYRHPSPPMFGAPPPHGLQHQTPYLVHSRGAWAPYPSPATPQGGQAYLTPVMPQTTPGTPGSSSMSAASTSSGTPDTSMTLGGGDDVPSPPDYGRGDGTASGADLLGVARVANMGQIQQMVGPLDNMPYYMPFNGRENHNEKERKRRTRIKNACQTLRSLVPGLSEKTDKATVFEFTVQYLLHLRRHLGVKHDKVVEKKHPRDAEYGKPAEFMEKYSPY